MTLSYNPLGWQCWLFHFIVSWDNNNNILRVYVVLPISSPSNLQKLMKKIILILDLYIFMVNCVISMYKSYLLQVYQNAAMVLIQIKRIKFNTNSNFCLHSNQMTDLRITTFASHNKYSYKL